MATIGGALYAKAVHEFFDGLRSYDVERAVAVLADDADLHSPWGNATGKEAIQAILAKLVEPSLERPSFTIKDIDGDGNIVRLTVSTSGRFGKGAKIQTWRILHLHGKIHQVHIS